MKSDEDDEFDRIERENKIKGQPYHFALQRTWVGLTDEDRLELAKAQHGWEDLCLAVEAKLKEKNT
jgi:hypothetical protein